MPKGADVVLSAGCAGGWYFDWFEEKYGPVKKHIGLELYSEKPETLPGNVEWIANSVDDMSDVENDSVDLLFSGQNIEHLDVGALLDFLKESNRVLKPGGHIVIDSPNRKVTTAGRYNQPEHTLELTSDEISDLVELSGFNVTSLKGIWNCRRTRFGDLKSPVNTIPEEEIEYVRRRDAAEADADGSFIWWLEAKKTGPVHENCEAKVEDIYLRDFPGFVRARFEKQVGKVKHAGGTETVLSVTKKDIGFALFGPYIPIFPGKYIAIFRYERLSNIGSITFDVCSNSEQDVHAKQQGIWLKRKKGWTDVQLPFEITAYATGLESRIHVNRVEANIKFGCEILKVE